MEEEIVAQSPPRRLNRRPRFTICLRLLGAAMLVSMALGLYAALDYLAPTVSARAQGISTRLSWYLQSGQSQADLRTLVAMIRFLIATEPDTGTVNSYSNLPVAGIATPNNPNS
jgi:hypothetical protein